MVADPPINASKPAFREQYPILLMRSMRAVRRWFRWQRRRTQRAGLLASSSSQQLKPRKIDIQVNIDPVQWFLIPAKDTRSSLFLTHSIHSFPVAMWTDVTTAEWRQYLQERLPRNAHADPAWDGDLRFAGGKTRQDARALFFGIGLPRPDNNPRNIRSAFA